MRNSNFVCLGIVTFSTEENDIRKDLQKGVDSKLSNTVLVTQVLKLKVLKFKSNTKF